MDRLGVCLLVSREYEHMLVALAVDAGSPRVSFMSMPHPSGITFDQRRGIVHVASTRNPNQVFDLAPVTGILERGDTAASPWVDRPLVPLRSRFLPGSLYLHDIALIGGRLHGNAVGHNAVVRIDPDGSWERVWWPRCIESKGAPDFSRNYLQLNSIAAGSDLGASAFSASGNRISRRRPGHRNYPVDGRGVVFSGSTREPLGFGLTRPHSARWYHGDLWVDDSGYGRVVRLDGDRLETVAELPGWTRGLRFCDHYAFVGLSRVIPRFRQYAPGLDDERSRCGVYAIDVRSGAVAGSITWAAGNQVFAVEAVPTSFSLGFPFSSATRLVRPRLTSLFYGFETRDRRIKP